MILGIDPGASGGVALVELEGIVQSVVSVSKMTEAEVARHIEETASVVVMVYIERVAARPGQGVSSMFKFGRNYGFYLGALAALRMPVTHVIPYKWQRALGCATKGDKRVTRTRAQELFPKERVTHATADALLIAEYGRMEWNKGLGAQRTGYDGADL